MPSVSCFPCYTLVRGNLCLHTFTYMTVTVRGAGVGDYSKQLIAAEKCIV